MRKFFQSNWFVLCLSAAIIIVVITKLRTCNQAEKVGMSNSRPVPDYWVAPSLDLEPIEKGEDRQQLIYGQDLIAHTSIYFGPEGTVAKNTNGMNCQNCHLNAGGKPFGNNYSAVASTYPKFRERSGTMESIEKRVNDCFERSLNGTALDTSSSEMSAILAYIKWLGKYVAKGTKPVGSGISDIPFLERAADPSMGKLVYLQKCQTCHGANGEGVKNRQTDYFTYPPLWGDHSYNIGAGLYRISRFAGYVKDNMPFSETTNHFNQQLSTEEAWDVSAFVNSQPRPQKDLSKDWPDMFAKPADHPFGPFADTFGEMQHKYGPFGPIKKTKEEMATKTPIK